MTTLVSILIPMYNSSSTIEETILSCINQTYNYIEIIIVDDGSTDNSMDIIKRMQLAYKNIFLYNQDKKGACSARNYAFQMSKGDFIQYLDADDILSPNKIEDQLNLYTEDNLFTLFSCAWQLFIKDIRMSTRNKLGIYKSYNDPINWLVDSWTGQGALQTACWLTTRKLILKAGEWNESLIKNQDGDFFCRVILQANKIIFSNSSLVYYRDSENSLSRIISFNSALSTLESINLYSNYIKDINRKDLQEACICNYLIFYRYYYPLFPELLHRAEERVLQSGNKLVFITNNKYIKFVTRLLGFKNSIFVEKKLKRFLSYLQITI